MHGAGERVNTSLRKEAKTMTNRRMPKQRIDQLKRLLSHAKMESANFNRIGPKVEYSNQDEMIKEETRLYRQTYLIYSIENLIQWANGEDVFVCDI